MRLVGLNVHPVKSTAIRAVAAAEVGRAGLVGDREWMVVDAQGDMVSARELPHLFSITADNAATGATRADLTLSAPGRAPIDVMRPTVRSPITVRMFGRDMVATPAGEAVDAWVSEAIGVRRLRLMWCSAPEARSLGTHGRDGDHAAFQDGFPVTLLTTASVARLDEWVTEGALERGEHAPVIGAERFRANLLVEGAERPFAEDDWRSVTIGDVLFRVAKKVDRCVMTTVDPVTFTKGKEPIRTMARHRREGSKTWMAVHLVPEPPPDLRSGEVLGTLRLGDDVRADHS